MDNDTIICNCMSVTQGMIKDAIKNGATSVEDIQAATSAGTVCGACIEQIRKLLGASATK